MMASHDSTAIPDPAPEPQAAGSPTVARAMPSSAQLLYWSVRRELWENRYLYIAPLIVAAVFLLGVVIGAARLGHVHFTRPPTMGSLQGPFIFASLVLMLTYLIVAAIYCLGALHNERADRSILFWKSLPVSDVTTVIAKASIPILLLPLAIFATTVGTHFVMLLLSSVVLLFRGGDPAMLWSHVPLLSLWATLLYHLLTAHALYYAPLYGWLLLASAWARRAAFLWAVLPVIAIIVIEKLVFDTSVFGHMLLSRLMGGPPAVPFPPHGMMSMEMPTAAALGAFLTSAGLWIGLAIFAAFLAAAVWLRRRQGPI